MIDSLSFWTRKLASLVLFAMLASVAVSLAIAVAPDADAAVNRDAKQVIRSGADVQHLTTVEYIII